MMIQSRSQNNSYHVVEENKEEAENQSAQEKSVSIDVPEGDDDKDSSSDEENDNSNEVDNKDAFEEILEIQKLRKRSHGVNAVTLASGKKVSKVDELVSNDADPFKLKSGTDPRI